MRSIGVNQLINKKFIVYPFADKWLASFGEPEKNFRMLVYGTSGNGKTEFCIQLAKYMAQFTKVYYNSFEQGVSKTLQDAAKRNNLQDVSGKLVFGNKESFPEMMQRLSNRNSPSVIFIDSRDYMKLTTNQYKKLTTSFPRKCFVIICWESAGKPKGVPAKDMEYMADIKVQVRKFKAYPRSRFGGNEPYVIWDRPHSGSRNLFNQKQ